MKKFTPIAMKCTQEEWESIKNFIPKKLIRKDIYGCFNSHIYTSYITNDYNKEGKISSTFSPECQEKRYETFDAKTFLNACGIKSKIKKDTIVKSVIDKFKNRSKVGIKKYGVTLDREDLSHEQWIIHAQEEAMDLILYLEKLKTLNK